MLAGLLAQEIAVEFAIGVGREQGLAPVAALGGVVRQAGKARRLCEIKQILVFQNKNLTACVTYKQIVRKLQ